MVFGNMMVCSLVGKYQCLGGTWLCHVKSSPCKGASACSVTSSCFY